MPDRSSDTIRECRLDCFAGLKSTKHGDGLDCCKREFGRNVFGDGRKSDDLDAQLAASILHHLQIVAAKRRVHIRRKVGCIAADIDMSTLIEPSKYLARRSCILRWT